MNRRDFVSLSILFFTFGSRLFPQTSADNSVFSKIMEKANTNQWAEIPISELICKIALEFIGFAYITGTLDTGLEERCVVTFDGFDCVTFFEVSLCLARIIKKQKFTFKDLIDEVTFTRYRNGKITDYSSRLHYSADWIYDNIKKGVVREITSTLGGEIFSFNLNFMSENPNIYKALLKDTSLISKIRKIELEINNRTHFVIPKDRIKNIESKLKNGSIIFFATSKKGLDYSHVGICFIENQKPKLLHASSKHKKVILDKVISDYVNENNKVIGITIIEPLEVA